MDIITSKIVDGTLFLCAHGRIDSSNSVLCEENSKKLRDEHPNLPVVLDCEELEYISSAGLRVVLRLKKDNQDLKVINANNDIYDILEMTGFTEMMPVEKAYRRLSVEGCEVIGKGANGEVYRLDPDTIIKVYLNPDSLPDIHRERELARRAFVLGIPTAIPYDVVRVGNGYGSVFELLNAKSFAKILNEEPQRIDEIVKMNVELLKKIHSTLVKPGDMPDQREVVLSWVKFLKDYLPQDKWQKLYSLVEAVSVDHHMMHGDYHVKNIMLQNGEYLLIDMDTLCHGDPIFEFASIFNAYIGFAITDENASEKFLGIKRSQAIKVWKDSLKLYFNTQDEEFLQSVENKSALIGYTRLLRRFIRRNNINQPENKRIYDIYRNNVLELIDKVDTLNLFK